MRRSWNVGERNPKAKVTRAQVADMRARRAKGASLASLAARYKLSESQVCGICRGTFWRQA